MSVIPYYRNVVVYENETYSVIPGKNKHRCSEEITWTYEKQRNWRIEKNKVHERQLNFRTSRISLGLLMNGRDI